MYTDKQYMLFEWDDKKAESNRKKHGVSFEEALTLFDDPSYLLFEDSGSRAEARFLAIGVSNRARTVCVVHCYREDDVVRIISARRATPRERRDYEERVRSQ